LAAHVSFELWRRSYAGDNNPSSKHHDQATTSKSAKALAAQISHIIHSHLKLEEKDAQVSAAVRAAVNDAIAGLTDPKEILDTTEELTTVAAQIAPKFTGAIFLGIKDIQPVTSISGATGQIQTAIVGAAATATTLITPENGEKKRDDDDGDGDDSKPDGDHDKDDVSPSH